MLRKERTIQRGNISFSTSLLHIDTDRWLKPPPESRRTGFFCWSTPGRVSKQLCSAEAGPNSPPVSLFIALSSEVCVQLPRVLTLTLHKGGHLRRAKAVKSSPTSHSCTDCKSIIRCWQVGICGCKALEEKLWQCKPAPQRFSTFRARRSCKPAVGRVTARNRPSSERLQRKSKGPMPVQLGALCQ